jgi:site-specific recombinase XerD
VRLLLTFVHHHNGRLPAELDWDDLDAAAQRCPSLVGKLVGKKVHPHVLRHSCAMSLLHAGVDTSVIALWLGLGDGVRKERARRRL